MRYAIFGVLSLLVIFLVELVHSWILMWLLYMALVLILLALRVTARPAKLGEVSRRLSRDYVQEGQPVRVEVTIGWQAARGHGWVLVQDGIPASLKSLRPCGQLTTLGGEPATTFSYTVAGQRRGFHALGPLKITVGDFFGLARSSATGEGVTYLTIYPRVFAVPSLRLPSNRPIGDATSTKRIYEDPTRIVGVRDYVPGDTLSKIHWKTTARTGSLVSKFCEPSTSVEVNILLNLHDDDYPPDDTTVDLACATAASIAGSLLGEKHLVGLQSNGNDPRWQLEGKTDAFGVAIRPQKGDFQNAAILSTLGRLQLAHAPSLAQYLNDVSTRLPWTASTLLITHRLTKESAVMLDGLKRGGFELAVIVIGEGEEAESARLRSAALHLPLASVPTEKHLGQLEFWQP
jgi:uncharacterized protein (DUF58 family)